MASTPPSIPAWLKGCRRGVPPGCAWPVLPTSRPALPFRVRELDRYVGSFTLSYECGIVKPEPGIFHLACRSLDVDPARTLMVGDSSNDAQAARAAGCPVVLVTYGYNHGQPVRAVDADGAGGQQEAADAVVAAAGHVRCRRPVRRGCGRRTSRRRYRSLGRHRGGRVCRSLRRNRGRRRRIHLRDPCSAHRSHPPFVAARPASSRCSSCW